MFPDYFFNWCTLYIDQCSSFDDTVLLLKWLFDVRTSKTLGFNNFVDACMSRRVRISAGKASSEGCGSRGASKLKSQVRTRSAVTSFDSMIREATRVTFYYASRKDREYYVTLNEKRAKVSIENCRRYRYRYQVPAGDMRTRFAMCKCPFYYVSWRWQKYFFIHAYLRQMRINPIYKGFLLHAFLFIWNKKRE